MVVRREKRRSNASSRGIKSDRSTIQFTRVTQPVSKVGRGWRAPQGVGWQPRGCIARCARRILAGSEHRRRKAPASEAPSVKGASKRRRALLPANSNGCVKPASSRSRGRKTSRRTPRHHGRRRDPQPKGWTASDEEAGAERSEALSPLASSQPERQERRRTNKDFVRWDAGAQRARSIRHGSNPAVEGPRRGPKPRKG